LITPFQLRILFSVECDTNMVTNQHESTCMKDVTQFIYLLVTCRVISTYCRVGKDMVGGDFGLDVRHYPSCNLVRGEGRDPVILTQ